MSMPEIYVSTDIETDGWKPGINSMLSIGSAAFFADKTLINTFTRNLEVLPDGIAEEKTMRWWKTQPEAWDACRQGCQTPEQAMQAYHKWLIDLPGHIIFVGYPVAFDYPFVSYYLNRFATSNPFGFRAIDIRSFSMGLLGCRYSQTRIDNLPERYLEELPHTHIALDDAIEQGRIFCNLLAASQKS